MPLSHGFRALRAVICGQICGLDPEINTVCRVSRAGQRCPAPVTLSLCGYSGVNAAFCTLFNGSDGIHLAFSNIQAATAEPKAVQAADVVAYSIVVVDVEWFMMLKAFSYRPYFPFIHYMYRADYCILKPIIVVWC